jgi:hypothetical protein
LQGFVHHSCSISQNTFQLNRFINIISDTGVFFNEETCKILQSSAIYHSINQRQDEALSDQDQMLHVITSLNLSGDKVKELTFAITGYKCVV